MRDRVAKITIIEDKRQKEKDKRSGWRVEGAGCRVAGAFESRNQNPLPRNQYHSYLPVTPIHLKCLTHGETSIFFK